MKSKLSLIFDIDDTLYNQIVPLQTACEETLRGRKLENPEKFYQIFCKRSGEMFLANKSGNVSLHQSRLNRISNTMKDMEIPFTEEMAEEFQNRYAKKQENLKPSKILSDMLDSCKRAGISLGVITNGPEVHQKNKFFNMGLDKWIPEEFVLVSEGVGYAKPDAHIFRIEEERMGITPEDTYMIGDSYANDMVGAMNAGWKTIWVNHHRYPLPEGGKQPDYVVYSEEELKATVEKIIGLQNAER